MRNATKLVTIRGITIYVHWTFLLLIAWIFIENLMAKAKIDQIIWSVIFILVVFACVLLHELGHALVASHYNIITKNIILLPIGGMANIEKIPDNPKQELAISIAGPLVNVCIALLLLPFLQPYIPFWKLQQDLNIGEGNKFLYNLHIVNVGLVIFNLIPAFPMDGGRIFRALLGFKMDYVKATEIAAIVGKVFAGLFILLGIITYNFILSIIGLFIIVAANAEKYYLRLKSLVKGVLIKEVLMHDYNSLQSTCTVQEAANILMNNHSKYFIVMENDQPIGVINRIEIIKAMAEMRYDIQIKKLMDTTTKFLEGEEKIEDVLAILTADSERIYPVVKNKHFLGVVNLKHIIEHSSLHKMNTKKYERMKSFITLLK